MRTELASLRGPLVLAILCGIPLVLWASSVPPEARFTGQFATLTSIAVLLAYAGTSAFALNIVLGARLRPVEALLGGLDRMYKTHRILGQAAFALLLGHVVFILAGRATTPGGKESSRALNLYLAGLATLGIAAFVYRSLLGNVLVRRRKYRVVTVNRMDEFVTEIVMEPTGKPLVFSPGQFLFVNFRSLALSEQLHPLELSVRRRAFSIRAGEIANQFHPFSITSGPNEPMLRITVKAVGDYTRALRRLETGAVAVVEGPYGSFSRNVTNPRQIWMAGGIGVTPFLSMTRSLDGNLRSIDFYYCVEHAPEAHFLDELRAIQRSRDDFRVVLVARDADAFLTAARVAEEHADLSTADVLICGPPAMIDNLRAQLHAVGVPDERIHAEAFGFAKLGRKGTVSA